MIRKSRFGDFRRQRLLFSYMIKKKFWHWRTEKFKCGLLTGKWSAILVVKFSAPELNRTTMETLQIQWVQTKINKVLWVIHPTMLYRYLSPKSTSFHLWWRRSSISQVAGSVESHLVFKHYLKEKILIVLKIWLRSNLKGVRMKRVIQHISFLLMLLLMS